MGLILADAAILAHRFRIDFLPAIVHELACAWSLNAACAATADSKRYKKNGHPKVAVPKSTTGHRWETHLIRVNSFSFFFFDGCPYVSQV
jgi:hypothetical protein